jgi:hypothetical protein
MQRAIANNFFLALVMLSICGLMLGVVCVYLIMLAIALCQLAMDIFTLVGGGYGG